MTSLTSCEIFPERRMLTKSANEDFNLLSGAPVISSSICYTIRPSGLLDDPAGNVFRFLTTSSSDISMAWKWILLLGSHCCLRNVGCFYLNSLRVSWWWCRLVFWAQQSYLNFNLQFACNGFSELRFLYPFVCWRSWLISWIHLWWLSFHVASLLIMIVARFLVTTFLLDFT